MEDFKVQFCRLCFTIIRDENYEVIDGNSKDFVDQLLKLDFDDGSKPIMCNVCSAKLLAAQTFRMACLSTDNTINCYVSNTTISPFDLREVYMKERANGQVADDIKVCRLCMQPVKSASEFKSINEEQLDMILKFMPEMNTFIVKEPIMCNMCQDSLVEHCNFLKQCSHVEQNTESVNNGQVPYVPPRLPAVDTPVKIEDGVSVKTENIDVEFEEDVPDMIKTECVDINCDEIKSERFHQEVETREDLNLNNEEVFLDSEDYYKFQKSPSALQLKQNAVPKLVTNGTEQSTTSIAVPLPREPSASTSNIVYIINFPTPVTNTGGCDGGKVPPQRSSGSAELAKVETPPIVTPREQKLKKELLEARKKIKRLGSSIRHYKMRIDSLNNVIKSLNGEVSEETVETLANGAHT